MSGPELPQSDSLVRLATRLMVLAAVVWSLAGFLYFVGLLYFAFDVLLNG